MARAGAKAPKKKSTGPAKKSAGGHHLIGLRLTPAMKADLDEVALEWRTTRSDVMRELIAHALKSPPKRKR